MRLWLNGIGLFCAMLMMITGVRRFNPSEPATHYRWKIEAVGVNKNLGTSRAEAYQLRVIADSQNAAITFPLPQKPSADEFYGWTQDGRLLWRNHNTPEVQYTLVNWQGRRQEIIHEYLARVADLPWLLLRDDQGARLYNVNDGREIPLPAKDKYNYTNYGFIRLPDSDNKMIYSTQAIYYLTPTELIPLFQIDPDDLLVFDRSLSTSSLLIFSHNDGWIWLDPRTLEISPRVLDANDIKLVVTPIVSPPQDTLFHIEDGGLYRRSPDNNPPTRLTDEATTVRDLRLYGTTLFFVDTADQLWRLETDGSGLQQLARGLTPDQNGFYVASEADRLWYFDNQFEIHVIRLDGTQHRTYPNLWSYNPYLSWDRVDGHSYLMTGEGIAAYLDLENGQWSPLVHTTAFAAIEGGNGLGVEDDFSPAWDLPNEDRERVWLWMGGVGVMLVGVLRWRGERQQQR